MVLAALTGCAERGPTPAEAAAIIAERQTGMAEMTAAMQAIGAEITSPSPDADEVAAQALVLAGNGAKISDWFPAGTGPASSATTLARPQVWMDPESFDRHAQALVAAAQGLEALAREGKSSQLMQQAMEVDAQCVACHKIYRPD